MNTNLLSLILILLIIINLICLCKNVKSNFNNGPVTTKDFYDCLNKGLNCSSGRLGCECPAGPASGIKGNLQLATETMVNID